MIDNAFARGYDHIKENSPREDFGETKVTGSCQIFAVADGHGDSNCPRSSFGSETACHTALAALAQFYKDIAESGLEGEVIALGSEGPTNQERIEKKDRVRQLIAHIVSEWRSAVNAEFAEHPLSPSEKEKCGRYLEHYDRGEKIEHIYGTTLIAGLLTEKYLLLLQQGDGRCDVFGANGEVSQPIPWDDKCFANVTTSLCEEDAVQRCRYCVIDIAKNPVIACIADSDGVEDSFASMELLHCYHRDVLIYACENGIPALHDYFKDTLPEMSEHYSRDDITICGFVDLVELQAHIPAFKRANERVRIESRLSDVDGRLKSFDSMGKLAGLKAQSEKASAEIVRIETELAQAKDALEIDSLSTNLQKAHEDKKKKEQAFKEYQGKKDSLLREREETQAELSRLGAELITESSVSIMTPFEPVETTAEQAVSATTTAEVTVEEQSVTAASQSSVANVRDTVMAINDEITEDLATKQELIRKGSEQRLQVGFTPKIMEDADEHIGREIPPDQGQYGCSHTGTESDCLPQIETQHIKKKGRLGQVIDGITNNLFFRKDS
jgi:hypothetical protein